MPSRLLLSSAGRRSLRFAAVFFLLSGLGLFLVAVSWDYLTGDVASVYGRKQVFGMRVAVLLLLTGTALSDRSLSFWQKVVDRPPFNLSSLRWGLVVLLIAIVTTAQLVFSGSELLYGAAWILLICIAAASVVLPRRTGAVFFLTIVSLQGTLAGINAVKVDLTGLPLTMLDIRLALVNPAGLWSALDLPVWTGSVVAATVAFFGALLLIAFFLDAASLRHRVRAGDLSRQLAGRLALLALIAMFGTWHTARQFAAIGTSDEAWDIRGVTEIAGDVGILTYLVYSYRLETANSGDFFNSDKTGNPPGDEEIRHAAQLFVDVEDTKRARHDLLPNVLIVLAESTFDPSLAFDLRGYIRADLFTAGESTSALGPLHVNAVGGGTWITEFEVLLGIDARIFGYSGYYTHASVSPFVTGSLATYARKKGYATWVFIPHEGNFYNYRSAYGHYGFEKILDSVDLRNSTEWTPSDMQIMQDALGVLGPEPAVPFLAHILLNENHGPHHCDRMPESFEVRFARAEVPEADCQLAEYLRRLTSTTESVHLAEEYLREREKRTGRPYVLLVYGDHQPFSFTGTESGPLDFDTVRTAFPKNITFFHIYTSMPGRVRCCDKLIPATLLPSLLSAYIASGVDDLFLPVNFWLYQQCGYNSVGEGHLSGLYHSYYSLEEQAMAESGRSRQCESAYGATLEAYRRSGLILSGLN